MILVSNHRLRIDRIWRIFQLFFFSRCTSHSGYVPGFSNWWSRESRIQSCGVSGRPYKWFSVYCWNWAHPLLISQWSALGTSSIPSPAIRGIAPISCSTTCAASTIFHWAALTKLRRKWPVKLLHNLSWELLYVIDHDDSIALNTMEIVATPR